MGIIPKPIAYNDLNAWWLTANSLLYALKWKVYSLNLWWSFNMHYTIVFETDKISNLNSWDILLNWPRLASEIICLYKIVIDYSLKCMSIQANPETTNVKKVLLLPVEYVPKAYSQVSCLELRA